MEFILDAMGSHWRGLSWRVTWTDLRFEKGTKAVTWIDGCQKLKLRDQLGEYFSAPVKGALNNSDSCRGKHQWANFGYTGIWEVKSTEITERLDLRYEGQGWIKYNS